MKASMKVHTQNNNHKKLKFFICAAAVIGVSIFVIKMFSRSPKVWFIMTIQARAQLCGK